jgi:uncharacterized protein YxeA
MNKTLKVILSIIIIIIGCCFVWWNWQTRNNYYSYDKNTGLYSETNTKTGEARRVTLK